MRITLLSISVTAFLLCASYSRLKAQSAFDQAFQSYKNGEYAIALATLDIQITQHESPQALMLRGDCYHKLGEYSKALDDYEKARITGYSKDDLLLNRGICKTSLALYESAKSDLSSYIQRREDDPKGYFWMATIEYLMMENRSSLRYLDQVLLIDSAYADAYYLRAANYADQQKMNLALEDFQEAMRLNPKMHRAKLNIAIILLDMGQNRNAIELLSELRLEDTGFIEEILYYKGEALYNMHDIEGACSDWVEAAQLGDRDAETNYNRLCIDRKGKPRFKRRNYYQF